ncbi:MAG: T9SS type A sorting domain-containing protein, partial [Bacteroidia bacterium]|nr:T9SS type A sorting domain-containing protein [Bacteroidia bacterium]
TFDLKNQPNPFTGKTNIHFNVKDKSKAKIVVYDLFGKEIFADNFDTNFGANVYEFDGSKLSSGIYFYTIHYKNYSETKRMVIAEN